MDVVLPDDLVRSLTYFDKLTEEYIGSIELPKIELSELQRLWNQPDDEPMVYSYPIAKIEQIEFFERILERQLETEKYDYFMELT
jgi:hypothetical protein